MKQTFTKKVAAAVLVLGMLFCHAAPAAQVHAEVREATKWVDIRPPEKIKKPDAGNRTVSDVLLRLGDSCDLELEGAVGKVKWTVSNGRILKIISKSGQKCSVKPMHSGIAVVTAAAQNKSMKYIVTIRSDDEYAKAWSKRWVEDYISDDMDFKTKLLTASEYLCCGEFRYGGSGEAADVITEKQGSCAGGANLLQTMYTAMGFKAKVRFAANDDMSRYPSNVIFYGMHFNVEVEVDGEKYYLDGTPGCGFVYLSSTDKLLFAGWLEDDGF